MTQKRYSIGFYDFMRDWKKDAETKTGLTKKQLLKQVEKILDEGSAPKIEIQLWRDAG